MTLIFYKELNYNSCTFFSFTLILIFFVNPTFAQDLSISIGDSDSLTERSVQLIILITVLSLVPGIAIMFTCFPFMLTVFGILRQGIGLQQSPPNMLIVSLSLFLTYFVMEPIFIQAWKDGIEPLVEGSESFKDALPAIITPFRAFMESRVNPETLSTLQNLRSPPPNSDVNVISLSVLVPSFLLSEMERAFQIGFLIFLPFLVIDLAVAAILMSMGMMMVPPVIVSLPFKLAFFVVADGWALVSGAVVRSYF